MSEINREKVQSLHDAATEIASAGLKMTMDPAEVLQLTTPLLEPHKERAVAVFEDAVQRIADSVNMLKSCAPRMLGAQELQDPKCGALVGPSKKPAAGTTTQMEQTEPVDVMQEIKRWVIDRGLVGRANYTDEQNALLDAYMGNACREAEPVVHHVSELEKVLAWIEKLPVPTQGATTNYSRLKSVLDACRDAAPVVDDELKQAINRLLDSDGSRGVYSAVRSYEARQELERMLAAAPDEILKICDRAVS